MRLGKETEIIEYKKSTGELKEGIISAVAMLNKHNRGELFFGVQNNGLVVGQGLSEKTLRDISQAISNHIEPQIFPSIKEVVLDDKTCINITFEGNNVPYFAYGCAYLRVADEDKVMSPKELEAYILRKSVRTQRWDTEPSNKTISDVSDTIIREYLDKASTVGRVELIFTDSSDVLNKLSLTCGDKIVNAANVMFCQNTNLEIQMAIFATDERLTFNDIKRESGTITELVNIAEKYIKNNIKWRVEFDGSIQRKEIPEIPLEAIREALVNSFCHRDYRISQNNEVSIYKNRVEIYNPGTFPDGLTPNDFIEGSERSIKRNPLLSQLLYYSKDIESFGTGLRRITEACKKANIKVDFQMLKTGFVVIFYRPEKKPITTEKKPITTEKKPITTEKKPITTEKKPITTEKKPITTEKKPITTEKKPIITEKKRIKIERENMIYDYIQKNGSISNKEARVLLGLAESTTKRLLKQMVDGGKVNIKGDKRARRYYKE